MSDENVNPENTPENPAPAPAPEKAEGAGRQMSFTVLDTGTVKAEFGPGLEALDFNPATLPESILADAITEGVISRLRGYTSKLTGENRTPEKLREAVVKGLENLFSKGIWKIEREPGDPGSTISVEAEAAYVFRQKRYASLVAAGKPAAEVGDLVTAAKQFASLTEEQKKQLKEVPLYKVAYAEVKARRAAENASKLAKAAEKMGDDTAFF